MHFYGRQKMFFGKISKLLHNLKTRSDNSNRMIIKAFSIIELLVVVVIILLLSIKAISMYKTYVIRSQANEALELLKALQAKVMMYYDSYGVMPTSAQIPNVNNPTRLISFVALEYNGGINNIQVVKIHATFSSAADANLIGKSIFIEGTVKNGAWVWLCRHSVGALVIDNIYLPKTCQYSNACPDLFCLDDL